MVTLLHSQSKSWISLYLPLNGKLPLVATTMKWGPVLSTTPWTSGRSFELTITVHYLVQPEFLVWSTAPWSSWYHGGPVWRWNAVLVVTAWKRVPRESQVWWLTHWPVGWVSVGHVKRPLDTDIRLKSCMYCSMNTLGRCEDGNKTSLVKCGWFIKAVKELVIFSVLPQLFCFSVF